MDHDALPPLPDLPPTEGSRNRTASIISALGILSAMIVCIAYLLSLLPSYSRWLYTINTPITFTPSIAPSSLTPTSVILITPQVTSPQLSAYYYEANLEGFGSYAVEELDPGAMDFEYPVYLFPNSSEVVTLKITPNLDVRTELPDIF